jgi:ribosomal protein L16/L10AE
MALTRPSGLTASSCEKICEIATKEITTGRKQATRVMSRNRAMLSNARAMAMPITNCTSDPRTEKSTLLKKAGRIGHGRVANPQIVEELIACRPKGWQRKVTEDRPLIDAID